MEVLFGRAGNIPVLFAEVQLDNIEERFRIGPQLCWQALSLKLLFSKHLFLASLLIWKGNKWIQRIIEAPFQWSTNLKVALINRRRKLKCEKLIMEIWCIQSNIQQPTKEYKLSLKQHKTETCHKVNQGNKCSRGGCYSNQNWDLFFSSKSTCVSWEFQHPKRW